MLIKITYPVIFLIFITGIANAQYFESVGKKAERILISLSEGDSLNPSNLNALKNILSSEIEDEVTKSYTDVNLRSIDSLKTHLDEFESEAQNISTDSVFVLFNNWFLHFQNIFYNYSKEKFFSSNKTKILFFSTSMSCHCTLEMCKNQTVELLKLIHENNNEYDYWVIDSYWHNDLQIKYETLFAPSVIVFDGNNQVLYKIEYEEKMLTQLTDYLDNVKN